jgi:hypothetical protein
MLAVGMRHTLFTVKSAVVEEEEEDGQQHEYEAEYKVHEIGMTPKQTKRNATKLQLVWIEAHWLQISGPQLR